MRSGVAARLLVVVLLAVAPLAPLAVTATLDASGDREPTPDAIATLEERMGGLVGSERKSAVDQDVLVVVTLKQGATLPEESIKIERVYTREGARHLQGYMPLSEVRGLSNDPGIRAVRIENIPGADADTEFPRHVASGVSTVGADALHRQGLTGENVTVGVIDTGFRMSDPEIAANVGRHRSFDGGTAETAHGTAVASVVADTAPDATLHLAAVGTTTTAEEYRKAITWLRVSGADIIVDAGSYFGQPGDGTGDLTRIAANASNGTLVITSAGNYGQRHWAGTHNASADGGWVEFAAEREGNPLAGGAVLSGRVRASLRWDDWPTTSQDYDLYLFRKGLKRHELIATSTRRQESGTPTEHIDTQVPRGRYFLAVRVHDAEGTDRLTMFASHNLTYQTRAGSLTAPGTAADVLTVGAYDGSGAAVFSSRGPVGDRPGVDLVAPDSAVTGAAEITGGTSYAAPYVAGTAALLAERHPDARPADLRAALRESATDVGPEGIDPASGYGLLDAPAAAEYAEEPANETASDDQPGFNSSTDP